jgi:hypothetical protein
VARAKTDWYETALIPPPSADQLVPSHFAMMFAVTPPAVVMEPRPPGRSATVVVHRQGHGRRKAAELARERRPARAVPLREAVGRRPPAVEEAAARVERGTAAVVEHAQGADLGSDGGPTPPASIDQLVRPILAMWLTVRLPAFVKRPPA